ncbi:MAG: hypothetical protein KDC24_05435 [Saprospiraceae bacterium]|nr:hypothetical protein [Saprospiraceae bacterium]
MTTFIRPNFRITRLNGRITPVDPVMGKLGNHKAVMEVLGIKSLDNLGDLHLKSKASDGEVLFHPKGILMPNANLTSNQKIDLNLLGSKHRFAYQTRNNTLKPKGNVLNVKRFSSFRMAANVIPIDVSYWFANDLIIDNNTDIIIDPSIKSLVIIANTIKIGTNVTLSWQRPEFPGIPIPPTPKKPGGYPVSGSLHAEKGRPGKDGAKGGRGNDGADAPEIEFWFLNTLGGFPKIDLRGQDGQEGGQGGNGSSGGNGQKGCPTDKNWAGTCSREQGAGGNGGQGGKGGDGGPGGNGGNGGRLKVYTTAANIVALNSSGVNIDLSFGVGGSGGTAGTPGKGGSGGAKGDRRHTVCRRNNRTAGKQGPGGRQGSRGENGQKGQTLSQNLVMEAITSSQFNTALTTPAILRTNRQSSFAYVGETISVHGLRFSDGDKVVFEDADGNVNIIGATTYVGENLLTVEVPPTLGGHIKFRVIQSDNTESINAGTLLIKPKITGIIGGDRIIPGKSIFIKGSGFDKSGAVYLNGQDCGAFKWVDYETIAYKVHRPVSVSPSSSGENATLKVINSGGVGMGNYNHSEPYPVLLDTFKMNVFGDSLGWGGGLMEHNKHYSLLKDYIESQNEIGVYLQVEAHQGAIIGRGKNQVFDKFHGELSTDYPTILQQMKKSASQSDAKESDLVVLFGGANDLEITKFMLDSDPDDLPKTEREFKEKIEKYCYEDLKFTINKALSDFPEAFLLVCGYFNIFSEKSDPSMITLFTIAANAEITEATIEEFLLGKIKLSDISPNANKDKIIALNKVWVEESTAQMKKAVEEINGSWNGPQRVFFVDPETKPENAAHAPQSFVTEPKFNSLLLEPQDEMLSIREREIDKIRQKVQNGKYTKSELRARGYSHFMSKRNSSYHPNKAGAKNYFEKAKEQYDLIPTFDFILLKSSGNKYLQLRDSDDKLVFSSGTVQRESVFRKEVLPNGKIFLRASNEQYVCAENGGSGEVNVNRSIPKEWETFEIVSNGSNRFSLKTSQGKFLKENSQSEVEANANSLAEALKFELI